MGQHTPVYRLGGKSHPCGKFTVSLLMHALSSVLQIVFTTILMKLNMMTEKKRLNMTILDFIQTQKLYPPCKSIIHTTT